MRGGALCPAARLLWCCLLLAAVCPVGAQAPVRTRDVGVATVGYDNGLTLGAVTLTETAAIERPQGALFATGLVSLFNDGRWSMQGGITGSRFSAPLPVTGSLGRLFRSVRGELSFNATSTAQQDFMPTLQLLGQARLHLQHEQYAIHGGGALARTFDGFQWRTTVLGDYGGWARVGPYVVSYTGTPMQLQYGDVLFDNEGSVSWTHKRVTFDASAGVRLGEAQRGTVAWGSLTATWPLIAGALGTVSVGNYPVDIIQGLPGARYAAVALRLPNGRFSLRSRARAVPAPRVIERPALPETERLALVIGGSLDSLSLREIRVWAPGITTVELMADFTDWIPVPLIKQPTGEWRGYYQVTPGIHRVNLRLNREELDVPVNLARVRDDFVGDVGLVIVR